MSDSDGNFQKAKQRYRQTWRPSQENVWRMAAAFGAMYRWFLATMLVINGGGLLALLNHPDDGFEFLRVAGFQFLVGLSLSVLSGLTAATASLGVVAPHINIIPPVFVVVDDSEDRPKLHAVQQQLYSVGILVLGLLSAMLAVSSFLCFLRGAVDLAKYIAVLHWGG